MMVLVALFLIIMAVVLLVAIAALLRMTNDADRRAAEMYRRWQLEQSLDKQIGQHVDKRI